MPADRRFIRYGLLVWLVAALGLLNWTLADMPVDISPLDVPVASDVAPKPAAGETSPEWSQRSLAELSDTVARPLFHPTRRPVVVRTAAPVEPDMAPTLPPEPTGAPASRLSLIGVMGTGGKNRRALLRAEGQAYGTWVDVGGEIDGWRLSAIEDNRVLIEKSGGREELVLHPPAKN
jgi:hypothetical protein